MSVPRISTHSIKFRFIPRWHSPSHQSTTRLHSLPNYQIARKTLEELLETNNRFPWKDEFEMSREVKVSASTIIELMTPLLTDERLQRIEDVCCKRTFDILPIVEHPYDWGNVAAVCRSADALGYGAVHVIRNTKDRYKQSTRTSGGADKWLDTQLFTDTSECLHHAKQLGYQIVATHLKADTVHIDEIDWTTPTAIILGNELDGVSRDALDMADRCIAVPMDGFVQSYNVSVAAALILWEVRRLRIERLGRHHDMFSPEEMEIFIAAMLLRSKGIGKDTVSYLLNRKPPEWQVNRGGKKGWKGREFVNENGETVAIHRQTTCCHFWDGQLCWGEIMLFPGKRCRYHEAHLSGTSTLDLDKMRKICQNRGLVVPSEVLDQTMLAAPS